MISAPPLLYGTILRARSGFCSVETNEGMVECQLRGRARRGRHDTDIAVIGDHVKLTRLTDTTGVIEQVEPRRSKFSRRQPGPGGTVKEDVMVANLDQVLAVFACAEPMPNPRLVDRFLVAAESNEVAAVVVVNKVDLCGVDEARSLFDRYERIGYPVAHVSAKQGIGLEDLREQLAGQVSIVSGPSGVGKLTLLNALQPGLRIATGEVSESLHKGRHTTTLAELHPIEGPRGGYVADTPGLRELGLWKIEDDELPWCFPEFRPLLGTCAFNDCRHLDEPRCAVRGGVDDGAISPYRYDSYRRLLADE